MYQKSRHRTMKYPAREYLLLISIMMQKWTWRPREQKLVLYYGMFYGTRNVTKECPSNTKNMET